MLSVGTPSSAGFAWMFNHICEIVVIKLFMSRETPFILCTIYHKLVSYHYIYKNIDSSNKVDSVDCTIVACASLHECAPTSQRLAQALQQFDSNWPLGCGFTTLAIITDLKWSWCQLNDCRGMTFKKTRVQLLDTSE